MLTMEALDQSSRQLAEVIPGPAHSPDQNVTHELGPVDYPSFSTVAELLLGGPSEAGYHMVSTYLECPEKWRLEAIGVRRKGSEWVPGMPLRALEYGLVWHALSAIRVAMDTNSAVEMLKRLPDITEEDRTKLYYSIKIYDEVYPFNLDPFDYIGVEAEVRSDIGDGQGGPLIRTVRYDTVVRYKDSGEIFSLERKSTSQGVSSLKSYQGQFSTQATLWNANPHLVKRYGEMKGVIGDVISKGQVPQPNRVGPFHISKIQQHRTIEWLRLPNIIRWPVGPDGSLPRMLHACQGRYGACHYEDLCLRGEAGSYEQVAR